MLNPLYSAQTSSQAKHLAQSALLASGENLDYVPPRFLPSGTQNKKANDGTNELRPSKANTGFTIFPNPSEKVFIVTWNWFEAGLAAPLKFKILSTQGQVLKSYSLKNYQNNQQVLNLEALAAGTYLLEISSKKKY